MAPTVQSAKKINIQPKSAGFQLCKKKCKKNNQKQTLLKLVQRKFVNARMYSLRNSTSSQGLSEKCIIKSEDNANSTDLDQQKSATKADNDKAEDDVNSKEGGTVPFEASTYEKLVLSLQSPLPNEHQFALETCLIISSKETNVLKDTPALLNMLLAHAGFFDDCNIRSIIEPIYLKAFRGDEKWNSATFDFAFFWEKLCYVGGLNANDSSFDKQMGQDLSRQQQNIQLLCECFPGKLAELSEVEKGILYGMGDDGIQLVKCCNGCPVKILVEEDETSYTDTLLKVHTGENFSEAKKITKRIQLVADILRNFSLDKENADIMMGSRAMLRFLLIAFQTNYKSIDTTAFDIISNIAKHCNGGKMPLSSSWEDKRSSDIGLFQLHNLIMSAVTNTFILCKDRNIMLRCLETINGLISTGFMGSQIIVDDKRFLQRLFSLLTLTADRMLTLCCLDCLFAVSQLGKVARKEIMSVKGWVTTLMSYVTVDETDGSSRMICPVAKSKRFTVLLILRNVINGSEEAKRCLVKYESQFANLAMSEEDCSWIVPDILYHFLA